jgi:peptidoglycan/xylan/chitin deacetylase (PgdA/CDA1 family)
MADIKIALTFDDGPDDGALAAGGETEEAKKNRTERVLNTLAAKGDKGAFFVQTEVPNRLKGANGSKMGVLTHSDGHILAIHNGNKEDHRCHKSRVAKPSDNARGANGLESDMLRAKQSLKAISGAEPAFVRATYGITNQACMNVYQARNLSHIYWDVDSKDTAANANKASVSATLKAETEAKLAAGVTRLIYLFHDTKLVTAQSLEAFIGVIDTAVRGKGHNPKFLTTAMDLASVIKDKARAGTDDACPAGSE